MNTLVAVNPKAGGGLAGRAWPKLSRQLERKLGEHVPAFADGPGDITVRVAEAVRQGVSRVIAVGGDGTVNEAVNGLATGDGRPAEHVALGVVPVGTGGDFARTFGIPSDPFAAVDRIAEGRDRLIDIGRVNFLRDDSTDGTRLFANIASLGLSGLIVRRAHAASFSGLLPGPVAYYLATVYGLLKYRFQELSVAIDDQPATEAEIALVAVANGRYFGGGMMIAPDAEPDDGMFDIVILKGTSKQVLLKDLRLVYRGLHRDHPSIDIARGRRVMVELGPESSDPVLLDVDGEAPGRLPATFEILPKALRLVC